MLEQSIEPSARHEVPPALGGTKAVSQALGVCIWLTGLSGAGKSTTANVLAGLLRLRGADVKVLDGDAVRRTFSRKLGFSKNDRDANVRRIGFLAAEGVRRRQIVIVAAISPYRTTRDEIRTLIGSDHFVEVFVSTPLDVCAARDTKGLYAKAQRGLIRGLTGVDDPYEPPLAGEIVLDTCMWTPEENAQTILRYLAERGATRWYARSQKDVAEGPTPRPASRERSQRKQFERE